MTTDYYRYDKQFISAQDFGLQNTGAICWWNSLLQVMVRLPALNMIILSMRDQLYGKNKLATAYIEFLVAIDADGVTNPQRRDLNISHASVSLLSALADTARIKEKKVRITGQESPIWGIGDFIELIDDKLFTVFNNKYESVIKCPGCKECVSRVDDKSVHIELYGIEKRKITLTTKEQYEKYILNHTTALEDFKCSKCAFEIKNSKRVGSIVDAAETINVPRVEELQMLREIIIIAFDADANPNKFFPNSLDFPTSDDKTLHYELVGMIEHTGGWDVKTGGSGHYFARAKTFDGSFKLFNDTNVVACGNTPMASSNLIFYHMTT